MTTFKIGGDPMPALRASRKATVNEGFNKVAAANAHLDQVYAQKRSWAQVQDPRLSAEASLRGITVAELSELILSKPDPLLEREMQRQKAMKWIDDAESKNELDDITKSVSHEEYWSPSSSLDVPR